jgi:Na+/proline symporter
MVLAILFVFVIVVFASAGRRVNRREDFSLSGLDEPLRPPL